MPPYVYSEPFELTENSMSSGNNGNDGVATSGVSESGSKRISSGNPVNIKLRINPGDHSLSLSCLSNDTISDIKKQIQNKTTAVSRGITFL